MLKKITTIMENIEHWPSRKFFDEIKESVRSSKFKENAKGKTYTSNGTKYGKQIEKEAEIIFADCIINWLSNKIRLTKISDDLVNAMADDTHLYCRFLEQHFTHSQMAARDASTFAWNPGRRLFYIILDVISPGRDTLSGAIIVKDERKRYQSGQNAMNFSASMQTIYESNPKTKMISFNPVSLFKISSHKRHLSKWFRESYVFDIEGSDEKLTPSEYLEQCYEQILESSEEKLSDVEINKQLKNRFSRKFRPWLVASINAYWFDVMVVAEREKHHKSQHVSQPLQRKQPISSYDRYTLCLIIYAWFGSDDEASSTLNLPQNIILKARFERLFPKSKFYYSTASKYITDIDQEMRLEIGKQEIKSEPEDIQEVITLVQKEESQAWSNKFEQENKSKQKKSKEKKQIFSDLSAFKGIYCKFCETEESKILLQHPDYDCPRCDYEEDLYPWWLDENYYLGKNSVTSPIQPNLKGTLEGKTKMKDWEKKIWDFTKGWAFLNSHIPPDSKTRIKDVITSKIDLIKRFKNPVTYV